MLNENKEKLAESFEDEYLCAFRDMVNFHVREGSQKEFLEAVFYATNQHSGSTVWGAVLKVAEEMFGYEYAKTLFHKR